MIKTKKEQNLESPQAYYLCSICGKSGPIHGYWSATDPTTHKFTCAIPEKREQ